MQESIERGKQTFLRISPKLELQMDNGKEYTIHIYIELVNKDYPDAVGIGYISIKNGDDSKNVIGDYSKIYPDE